MGTSMYAEEAKMAHTEVPFTKTRKMNWFKKMIINWVREDWEHAGQERRIHANRVVDGPIGIERDTPEQEPKLNFKVYPAIGGTIVEFRRIDRKIDRSESTLYIIGKDEDFGEKIARIATLEHLK
jgi:hypothetical protein